VAPSVRRSSVLTLSGALLLGASTWAIGIGLMPGAVAPRPSTAAAGTLDGDAAGNLDSDLDSDDAAASIGRSQPIALDIPSIDVHSQITELGQNPDGTIEVPQPGPEYDAAAWYRYSPTPGERGPAIIEGHLHTERGPSVFYRLGALLPGDEIDIRRADGRLAIFRVTAVREYTKTQFPTADVYGDLDHSGLRLITCGGDLDPVSHRYLDNTVVYADLIGAAGAPV
jgi:sortase (surface protein transpeptidase)